MPLYQGTSGNDSINGSSGNDTIQGNAGNDTLNGGGGNDLIFGGAGNDTLNGGNGHDTLHGGGGDNQLTGGTGNDVFVFDPSTITDFSRAAGNNDVIDISVTGLTTFAAVMATAQQVGSDTVFTFGAGRTLTVKNRLPSQFTVVDFGFAAQPTPGPDTIGGTEGNDTIDGGGGNDVIDGNGGDDSLSGGDGDDTIDGGAGSDIIDGGDGNDTLAGGAGDDWLSGGAGQDVFVFRPGEGISRVMDFNVGGEADYLVMTGFGFTSTAEVMAHFVNTSSGVYFDYNGTQIAIFGTNTATIQNSIFIA